MPIYTKMKGDNKICKEKEKKRFGKDKRDVIQGDHNLLAKEFNLGSRIVSRFAICTLLAGCFWSYPMFLVSNITLVRIVHK